MGKDNQHFVPVFYGSRFTNEATNTFYTYDLRSKVYDSIHSPEDLLKKKKLYEPNRDKPTYIIENELSRYESKWGVMFNEILDLYDPRERANCIVEYRHMLVEFCIFQFYRTELGMRLLEYTVKSILDGVDLGNTIVTTEEIVKSKAELVRRGTEFKNYITQDFVDYFRSNNYSPKIALIDIIESFVLYYNTTFTVDNIEVFYGNGFWLSDVPTSIIMPSRNEVRFKVVLSPYLAIELHSTLYEDANKRPNAVNVTWYNLVKYEDLLRIRTNFLLRASNYIISITEFTERDRQYIESVCGYAGGDNTVRDFGIKNSGILRRRLNKKPKKGRKRHEDKGIKDYVRDNCVIEDY